MKAVKTLLAIAAAGILHAASAAVDLFPLSYYYLDGGRVVNDGTTQVVSPSDENWLHFDKSTNFTFTALAPAGHKLDDWKLYELGTLNINALTLDSLKARRTYTGETFTLSWTTNFTGVSQLYLSPCFSWLDYKLAYKSNQTAIAGDFGVVTNIVYTNTVTIANPSNFWTKAITGYDVAGWSLSSGGDVQFAPGQAVANAGEAFGVTTNGATVYLYAVWAKRAMRIALDAQGGSVASNSITAYIGEKYSLPTPERKGFTFKNWTDATSGGSTFIDGVTSVTRDDITKLYAQWEKIGYSLVYNWNWSGAGAAPAKAEHDYTNAVTLAAAPASWKRAGYDFAGWSKTDSTNAIFSAGQKLAMSGEALGVAYSGQQVTLYGVWRKRTMEIALDAQGGSVATNSVAVKIDENYTLPSAPTKEGFEFAGWFTQPDGGEEIASLGKWSTDEIDTLYAQWKLIEFTLAYDENAGDDSRSVAVSCGWTNAVTLAEQTWTRLGWDFLGWAQDENADAPDYAPGERLEKIGAVFGAVQGGTNTLYAVWERHAYSLALDANGGEVYPTNIAVYVAGRFELPEPLPRRDAWFDGWWTLREGGNAITNNQVVDVEDVYWMVSDPAIYAHWRAKEIYDVTMWYIDEGGNLTNAVQNVYEKDAAEIPGEDVVDAWTGHTFIGWEPEIPESIEANGEFAALYKTNEYDIVFYANGGQGYMAPMHLLYGAETNLTANTLRRGKTEAWTFVGWAYDEDSDVADFADGALVESLTAEDGGVVELNAVWTNALTDYSRALGTDIVLNADDETKWVVTNGIDIVSNETGVVETPFNMVAMSVGTFNSEYELSGKVYGRGSLSFLWKVNYNDTEAFKFRIDETELATTLRSNDWQKIVIDVSDDGEHDVSWKVPFLGAYHHFLLRDVTWTPEGECEVSFDANGGEGEMASATFYAGEYGTLPRNKFVRTGWTFTCWRDGEGREYSDRYALVAVTNDTLLTAQWQANEYSISFDANGGVGEMPDQTLTYDVEAAIASNAFVRTGYAFTGWKFADASFGDCEVVSNLTAVAGETLDFAAQWKANDYSVEFDANGGDGAMGVQAFTYDVAAALASCAFTREGYVFDGWEFGGETFADGEGVSNLAADDGAVVTLKALWKPVEYTVEFDPGDADGDMDDIVLAYDAPQTLPPCAFTKTGYTFDGWKFGDKKFADDEEVVNLSAQSGAKVVLTATWQANGYRVAFMSNDGEGEMDAEALVYDASAALTPNAFTRKGYKFAGWATSKDGEVVFADGADVANLSAEDGATVELFAVWQPISYTIRFDAADGSGEMPDIAAEYDVAVTLPDNAFVRDGYSFEAWECGGVQYGEWDVVKNLATSDRAVVVFAAVWSEDEIVVPPDTPIAPPEDEPDTEVFANGESDTGEFTAATAATYNGWLRDTSTGRIAALITVKTTAVKKEGAESRSTIKVTPFEGRKATYKTTVAPGGNPVDEYGIVYGASGLTGEFDGLAVEAALDFSKAKTGTPERALVDEMPLGTWTCAFAHGDSLATFSVRVSKKGKAKINGYLADGKKVSISAQGILGTGGRFAIPVMNARKDVGFVLWIEEDGSASVSDCAVSSWTALDAAELQKLPDGLYSLDFEMPAWRDYLVETDLDGVNVTPIGAEGFSVAGNKWKGVKSVGRIALDKNYSPVRTYVKIKDGVAPSNLAALKMSYTANTGIAKCSFKLWYLENGRLKSDRVSVTGALVNGSFLGTATVKKFGGFKVTSK